MPPEAVDDIVAETFLVVWRRLDDVPEPPLPWLLTVARNVAGTERRGAARRQRLWLKAQTGRVEGYDPGGPEIGDGRILGALARLNERDREVLTLVAWDGLTPAQAAAVLGEPSVRFRQRLHRAGQRLRAELAAAPRPGGARINPSRPRPHRRLHMNTPPGTDPELLALIRRVDPMRDPRVQADAGLDTEAALRLLAPELDRPSAVRGPRRWRPRALRVAVLAGAVVAALFVVANVGSTGDGSAVSPAQAMLISHVRAATLLPPRAIYEEEDVSVTGRDGSTVTPQFHDWKSTSPPYNTRSIEFQNGKVRWEQSFVNGRLDLYDPATNTIYLAPSVLPHQVPDNPNLNSSLSEVHDLLTHPGGVTVNAHAVLDGAPAIKFNSDGGRFSYWVSPSDYRPLQVEDRLFRAIGRFPIVRVLTGASASPRLLSLQAQLPGAKVDASSADYQAARQRLILNSHG